MERWKKLAIFFAVILAASVSFTGCGKKDKMREIADSQSYESLIQDVPIDRKTKLKVWYTEESDGKFLTEAAEAFEEKYGASIQLEQQETVTYLEKVYETGQKGKGPDLYLLPHNELKKAEMAGLAKPVTLLTEEFFQNNYPDTAILSASLKDGSVYGYPLYFDTYFLVYDSALVKRMPKTFDDILNFTEEFSDEMNNKTIFKWDLSDPYFNYMFLGDTANVFGQTGDDTSEFRINGINTIKSMEYFQELSNYLFGNMTTSSYEAVKKAVEDKKVIFAICKTDILPELQERWSEYKSAPLPDLTKELKTGGLSTTQLAVINGYSKQDKAAELFASFLSYDYAKQQYDLTGKLSTRKDTIAEDNNFYRVYQQYEKSIPVPKAIEMGDFWANIEIADTNIWNGGNVTKELKKVQQVMQSKLKK